MNRNIMHKYQCHKSSAKYRGIEFRLTFEEWWGVWEASGKWEQRGRSEGMYCMSRYNDQGPYEIGNVYIQLWTENTSQAHKGKNIKKPRDDQWRARQAISQGDPVIVNYIEYTSISAASKATGLRRDSIVLKIAKKLPGFAFK